MADLWDYRVRDSDLGVIFRSRQQGVSTNVSMVGFWRCAEIHRPQHQDQRLDFEILSDSALVVYHISHRRLISRDLALFQRGTDYKRKNRIPVSCAAPGEHRAYGLIDTPAVKPNSISICSSGNNAALL
jgi:hypothetical protein